MDAFGLHVAGLLRAQGSYGPRGSGGLRSESRVSRPRVDIGLGLIGFRVDDRRYIFSRLSQQRA